MLKGWTPSNLTLFSFSISFQQSYARVNNSFHHNSMGLSLFSAILLLFRIAIAITTFRCKNLFAKWLLLLCKHAFLWGNHLLYYFWKNLTMSKNCISSLLMLKNFCLNTFAMHCNFRLVLVIRRLTYRIDLAWVAKKWTR